MHCMILYEVVLLYMHNVGPTNYMMKVDDMNEVVLACYMDILIVC